MIDHYFLKAVIEASLKLHQEETHMEHKTTFDQWALVELMGHQRIAGRVTEAEIGGSKFVRVDVPEVGATQPLTKYLGPSAIYAITPITEETARALAGEIKAAPISSWDARHLLAALPAQPKVAALGVDEFEAEDADDSEDVAENDPVF